MQHAVVLEQRLAAASCRGGVKTAEIQQFDLTTPCKGATFISFTTTPLINGPGQPPKEVMQL
jgi:hypothetical protein